MGIAGNVLVLVVIVTQAHMQTTTNMYILNMAAADILMCLGRTLLQEEKNNILQNANVTSGR